MRVVAWSEKRRRGNAGRRGGYPATFPHHADVEATGSDRREAMSVTSGNYARVPVAIGLLILLGACWERTLLAPRLAPNPSRAAARRGITADGAHRMGVVFVGGTACEGRITSRPIGRRVYSPIVAYAVHVAEPFQVLLGASRDSVALISRYTRRGRGGEGVIR